MTNGNIFGIGMTLTSLGTLIASLAWEVDNITAVREYLVDALGLIKMMFFDPDCAKIGVEKEHLFL